MNAGKTGGNGRRICVKSCCMMKIWSVLTAECFCLFRGGSEAPETRQHFLHLCIDDKNEHEVVNFFLEKITWDLKDFSD